MKTMDDRNFVVNISTGTVFKVALVGILFWLAYILHDLILVLLTAVVIASAIEPATNWFAKYKVPRIPAVIIVYLLLVGAFIGLFYLFVPPLFQEVSRLSSAFPEYINTVNFIQPTDFGFNEGSFVTGISERLSIRDLFTDIENFLSGISGGALQTLSTVFGGVFSFILIVVISFYLAVQERGIENFLRIVTPVRHEDYVINLWERSQAKIGKWMQGQLLLGVLIGVLVYLGLTVLGVPYAFLLAILAAFMELIPIFGPVLAAVPAVIIGFLDSVTLGLLVIGLYVIIQQFENHLIYPLVVRKVVGVPPLLVILALIIGAKIAGFLGVILSVPVAAAILEFMDDVQKRKAKELEDYHAQHPIQ